MSAGTPLRTVRAVVKRIAIISLLCAAGAAPAAAQDAACPEGNLLAGKTPIARVGVTQAGRLTDGVMPGSGDVWQSDATSVLSNPQSHVVYDLGAVTRVSAVDLQGDNNDEYIVELSDDGQSFSVLWVGDTVSGEGMRRRGGRRLQGQGRYVRIRAAGGDGFYSLGEVQLFCQTPAAWPPPIDVKPALAWWMKNLKKKRDNRYRLILASLGLLFFIALFRSDERRRWLYGVVGLSVAMLAIAAYRLHGARLAPWFAEWGVYVLSASSSWPGRPAEPGFRARTGRRMAGGNAARSSGSSQRVPPPG